MTNDFLAGFVVNLLQDVNVLRPLIYLASDDLNMKPNIFVTQAFINRDRNKIWIEQLNKFSSDTGSIIHILSSSYEAWSILNDCSGGFLVSASESDLNAHKEVHNIFKFAPEKVKTITLQHGFECVGFLMNKNHQKAHGDTVSFAADYVCGWVPANLQRNLRPHQKIRYLDMGPVAWIPETSKRCLVNKNSATNESQMGIVCENLHSARHGGDENRNLFMEQFFEFADFLSAKGQQIALRPHPGGQYTIKNQISLPKNVVLVNQPSYEVDWSSFSFGISAPSSVLFDFIINNVPAIVWQDEREMIDISQVSFLPIAKSTSDMIEMSQSSAKYSNLGENQQLKSILRDPKEIISNFTDLFCSIRNITSGTNSSIAVAEAPRKIRVLIMCPALIPTLTISFLKPISLMNNLIEYNLIHDTGTDILDGESGKQANKRRCERILDSFKPDVLLMCRQYGYSAVALAQISKKKGIKLIYHIDDLLFDPSPEVLDQDKYLAYKKRAPSILDLIRLSDLVYCSTPALHKELSGATNHKNIYNGRVYKSVDPEIITFSETRKKIIGYTGFGHTQDLELIEDSILEILNRYPDWEFELIGTIVPSNKLLSLKDRLNLIPPERDYDSFISLLKSRNWSIGICPLINNRFNSLKANTKWIEYSCCNIATVASNCEPYNYGTEKNSILRCNSLEDWTASLDFLINDSEQINRLVKLSQLEIKNTYSDLALSNQVYDVFNQLLDV